MFVNTRYPVAAIEHRTCFDQAFEDVPDESLAHHTRVNRIFISTDCAVERPKIAIFGYCLYRLLFLLIR
jgi:hypothetical protein